MLFRTTPISFEEGCTNYVGLQEGKDYARCYQQLQIGTGLPVFQKILNSSLTGPISKVKQTFGSEHSSLGDKPFPGTPSPSLT